MQAKRQTPTVTVDRAAARVNGVRVSVHVLTNYLHCALQRAILDRGRYVTRTPFALLAEDGSGEEPLIGATASCARRGAGSLFAFNIRDFMALAGVYPRHGRIILAAQLR